MPTAPGATTVHICLTPALNSELGAMAINEGLALRPYITSILVKHVRTYKPSHVDTIYQPEKVLSLKEGDISCL